MTIKNAIAQASKSLPADQAILLFLAVVLEQDRASHLFEFLGESQSQEIQPHLQRILDTPKYERRFPLLDAVQLLSQRKPPSQVDEFDGSWLLHFLKGERPAVIGLILKHLPADKVYQVLNLMDPELRAQLPDTESLERVPEDLVQTVRSSFERQLSKFSTTAMPRKLGFHSLSSMSSSEIATLVSDLGLDLLAVAFQGVSERPLIELVKNLDESDAEKLYEKFNAYRDLSRSEIKSAQMELLGLSLEFATGVDLVMEAGVKRLARALLHSDTEMIMALQYKLPFKNGHQLLRYLDDFRRSEDPSLSEQSKRHASRSQDYIVQRIVALSQAGDINEEWATIPLEGRLQ